MAFDCSALVGTHLRAVDFSTTIGEGAILSTYRFAARKQKADPPRLGRLVLVGPDVEALQQGSARAMARADAVACTRDLVDMPAGDLTPRRFAELARERGAQKGFSVDVHDEHAVAEMVSVACSAWRRDPPSRRGLCTLSTSRTPARRRPSPRRKGHHL